MSLDLDTQFYGSELELIISELETEREEYLEENQEDIDEGEIDAWGDTESGKNLTALYELNQDLGGAFSGTYFIEEDSFYDHAKSKIAEHLGVRETELSDWPLNHLDIQAAADQLQHDYTYITLGDKDYYYLTS